MLRRHQSGKCSFAVDPMTRAVAFYSSKVPLWWCHVCVCSAWADEEGIQRPLLDSLLLAVQMRFRIHEGFSSIHDSERQPPA